VAALLSTVRAQPTAVEILRRALASTRVHHAYLFDGPDGVGKELLAFALAQALVCERRTPGTADACGECRACLGAVPRPGQRTPLHPDVVVLERGLYDPSAIGRRSPEVQDISIDQIRTLVLVHAAFPPREGRAKVYIVRRAEELSLAAANALLKTLEEPGSRTHFVLLSSAPQALLPTIRSRVQRVRFGALPDIVIADLLAERGMERSQADAIAPLSGGSMTAALLFGDQEASEQREQFVTRAIAAIEARNLGPAMDVAEEAKRVSKETMVAALQALAAALAALGRSAAGTPDRQAERAAAWYALALAAVRQIQANAAMQLALEAMFAKMRSV
jgi:DNA polymerase-3 subunit delta'